MGELAGHLAKDEGVDLRVDLDAPAHGAVDGGGSFDDLDLLAREQIFAAELGGDDHAVDTGIDHLLHGPGGHVAELLGLVTGLHERFAHVGEAVEDGGVVKRFLAIENLLSDQRRASGSGVGAG